jgi:hypothetical protein
MEVVLLVHVRQTLKYLENDVSDHVFGEQFLPILHHLVHVLIEILKDEVKCVLLKDHLVQLDDVRMRQLDQRLNLLLVNAGSPLMVLLLHLLNCNNFTCLPIHALDHRPIGSISNCFDCVVLIHFTQFINQII